MAGARPQLRHTVPVRVLVVEDERRLAAAVKRGLEASGFVVDLAHDGVTGLHMAREGGSDAVVLDIMPPGLSGYNVCSQLRAEENCGLAIVRATARTRGGTADLEPAEPGSEPPGLGAAVRVPLARQS